MYDKSGWFTDTAGEQLFRLDQDKWYSFIPIPLRRRKRTFHRHPRPIEPIEVPTTRDRASIYYLGDTVTLTGHGAIEPCLPRPVLFYHDHFWSTWQCEYTIEGSVTELSQAIQQGQAIAVSDGSYQLSAGAAAWTIEGHTKAHRIKGAGLTPGHDTDQSAYRSELFGLWGILYSLKQFTTQHNIISGHVRIACDGLSALRKAQVQRATEPSEAHYDLILAIRHLQEVLPLLFSFIHVKGHQDSGQITVLSCEAWMNIKMDEQAKLKVNVNGPKLQVGGIPYEGWVCAIEGKRIVKHLTENLRKYLNGGPILNHWATKQRFRNGTKDIDWEMTSKAMQALPPAKQRWVSKLATKFLPYGTNMKRWRLRTQSKCPRCECADEDKAHILRCQAPTAAGKWKKAIEELDIWLQATRTHPQLRQDLISGLQKWHDDQPITRAVIEGTQAGTAQDDIGWGVVMEGCLSVRWREEQDIYWKAIKSRKSSKRWTTALIKRLMLTAWDMWNQRNEALHDSERNKQEIVEGDINQQITQVYNQVGRDPSKEVRRLTQRPLRRLLQLPAPYKRQWMATIVAVRNKVQTQQARPGSLRGSAAITDGSRLVRQQ